mmetsp:Transcript_793/g.2047  ORF Transcript_793/g.2047 Transcript_793/m.2047 type:complete len:253 (-) Transcript_793:202-960(-)
MAFSRRTVPLHPERRWATRCSRASRCPLPASMVSCSSRRRCATSAFICRWRSTSSGKGYRLALNASQIFSTLARARSPEKNTTKTHFSTSSRSPGSTTRPQGCCLRNMLPRVARNTTRSNGAILACGMSPATKPSRLPPSRAMSGASMLAASTMLAAGKRLLAPSKNGPAVSSTSCSSTSSACDRRSLSLLSFISSRSRSRPSRAPSSSSRSAASWPRAPAPAATAFPPLPISSRKNLSFLSSSSHRFTWLA